MGWRWMPIAISGDTIPLSGAYEAICNPAEQAAYREDPKLSRARDGFFRIVLQYYPSDFQHPGLSEGLPVFQIASQGFLSPGVQSLGSPAWGEFRGLDCPCGADPLAGIFYLLAACAEYPQFQQGINDSKLRQLQFVPLADRLVEVFAKALTEKLDPQLECRFLPQGQPSTFDVDAARAIQGKSFPKQVSTFARALFADLKEPRPLAHSAARSLLNSFQNGKDPFDQFELMRQINDSLGLRPKAFSLCGYGTSLDPGWPFRDARYARLWRDLDEWTQLGIHPSYFSSERPELFAQEHAFMSDILGREVRISRQHFLRFQLPSTFRYLEELGIEEDHSFGWTAKQGFRLGTARSMRWYDLEQERMSKLRLVPPHGMDITARRLTGDLYRQNPQEARRQILSAWQNLAKEARQSGSTARIIWHNSSLSWLDGWQAEAELYEQCLKMCLAPEEAEN